MGICVLGPLAVDDGDPVGPRDRVVLAALAMRRGEVVSAEQMAEALWADELPASWNKVVQGCVVRLRKRLGPAAIETATTGYRLTLPADAVDVTRFERLVERGRELSAFGEPERAALTYRESLHLWRGRALPELDAWATGRIEGDRLEELRLDVEEAYLDAMLAAGRHREVLAEAQARVSESPLREHRWALLARAQYQCGLQGEALRVLARARQVLCDELGVQPGPELRALEQALLRQDPSLEVVEVEPDAGSSCPYRGLVPYDVDDAEAFFGRDLEVSACLRRMQETGAVVVVGPSGSGKSSLVRAGVAAALRRDLDRVVVITPGATPMAVLADLDAFDTAAVLVVDQCEEAVTLCTDAGEQSRFFAALAAHAERAPLVVAVRADHLASVSGHGPFARLVERSLHLLGPMGEAELRAAIEGPARQAGLLLEPGLVDLLEVEVEGEPGALPLLSHALHETWQRREGRTLTVAAYRASGGIRQAVGRSAESLYEAIDPEHHDALRDLLLRLVTPMPEGEPVRTKVPAALVGADPVRRQLVERLVAARLLTSDDGAIELAHESLVRAWPRLQGWLNDDVEGQRILRHLTATATSWEALGRPESELYRGVRLAAARDWQERARPTLAPVEAGFLEASLDREAADLATARAQVHRERRTVRRLRGLVGAVAVLALVAIVASVLATEQERRADERATVAEARRIGADALVEPAYDRALLLAVEAVRLWDSSETRGNLATTIERSPGALAVARGGGGRLMDLRLSSDGTRAAVSDSTDDVTLFDLAGGRQLVDIGGEEGRSYRVPELSPDGRHVAVSMFSTSCWLDDCPESAVELRSSADGSLVERYDGLGLPAAGLAFSPDGTLLAAAQPFEFSAPENIAIWRVGEPSAPMTRLALEQRGMDFRPTPDSAPPGWITFSPHGAVLYASGAGPTVAFDVASGEAVRTFPGLGGLAVSDDGRLLAARTTLTQVGIFDTASGRQLAELVGHGAAVTRATFGPDGESVATASNDGTAAVWDTESGRRLQVLEGHADSVLGVAFGESGAVLHTASADGSLMTWDLGRSQGLVREVAPPQLPDVLRGVLVGPRGARAVFLDDTRMRFAEVGRGSMAEAVVAPFSTLWGAFLPDGRTLATVGAGGQVALFDASTGDRLVHREGRGEDNAGAIAVMPDGRTIVVADVDGTVTELDASTLEPTGRTVLTGVEAQGIRTARDGVIAVTSSEHTSERTSEIVFADLDDGRVVHRMNYRSWGSRAAFSPDGSRYALGAADGRLTVVDPRDGAVIATGEPVHEGGVSWVTFSPDGRTVASIGFAGELVLTDARTGAVQARMRARKTNVAEAGMEFRPDGRSVVIAYSDGSMHSYGTDPQDWLRHACAVSGRDLTVEEWGAAFGARPWRSTCEPWSPASTG